MTLSLVLCNMQKNKHIKKKQVKYQKIKHKKSKWMTTGILNSINTKDRMYKFLLKTNTLTDRLYDPKGEI